MSIPDKSDRCLCDGKPHGTVEFAVVSHEKMAEAWGWWNKLDVRVKRRFAVLMDRLVSQGFIRDETSFKQLDGPIWEFKRDSFRLLCYRHDGGYILTNGLKKGGRKDISADIEKANRIGERHLKWAKSQEVDSEE